MCIDVDRNPSKKMYHPYQRPDPRGAAMVETMKSNSIHPSYTLAFRISAHSKPILVVKFSPNGYWLASAADDSLINIWKSVDGMHVKTLGAHKCGISDVAWSKDSLMLVSASDDQTLIIWNLITSQIFMTLKGHTDYVFTCDFNPQGTL
ncbi:WD repeat-containing protein 5, partial [Pseudolycoriella hygida]